MQSRILNSDLSSVWPWVRGFSILLALDFLTCKTRVSLNCLMWLLPNKQLYMGHWLFLSERQCSFQNHSGYNMKNRLEECQDGSRLVRRSSRHEAMLAWTRAVAVGGRWA